MTNEEKPLSPRDFEEVDERTKRKSAIKRALEIQLGNSEWAEREADQLIQREIDCEDEIKLSTDEGRKSNLRLELEQIRKRISSILSKE